MSINWLTLGNKPGVITYLGNDVKKVRQNNSGTYNYVWAKPLDYAWGIYNGITYARLERISSYSPEETIGELFNLSRSSVYTSGTTYTGLSTCYDSTYRIRILTVDSHFTSTSSVGDDINTLNGGATVLQATQVQNLEPTVVINSVSGATTKTVVFTITNNNPVDTATVNYTVHGYIDAFLKTGTTTGSVSLAHNTSTQITVSVSCTQTMAGTTGLTADVYAYTSGASMTNSSTVNDDY